ncbi:collagen alpha-1(I) chain-like [Corvus hawaiiensis]|uniref:collagen alpha-1(I) chain-like n=1 Tax=Corvus hawaiiensis TaxID=134902 RepID=UPI0020185DCA|nr:collagen alpha-1(I) chain-like [Corvus hawaiiensis]
MPAWRIRVPQRGGERRGNLKSEEGEEGGKAERAPEEQRRLAGGCYSDGKAAALAGSVPSPRILYERWRQLAAAPQTGRGAQGRRPGQPIPPPHTAPNRTPGPKRSRPGGGGSAADPLLRPPSPARSILALQRRKTLLGRDRPGTVNGTRLTPGNGSAHGRLPLRATGLAEPALHRAQPGRLGGGSPRGPALPGTFFRSLQPCQICPWGKLPRAKRSLSGIRTSVPAGPPPGRAEPRCRGPLPCLSPVLVFLSVLRTVHGKRQFCSSRGRSAGWGGVRPPEPPLLPAPGAAALPRAEGARSPAEGLPPCALLKTGSSFELSPFFFPPFPPSPLPFLPPPSLSFPLSLLSLPFSLSLSCIHGWHSEPLCIYVHNKAARPLHFICIITISVQAHHIVCCLHLLLRLLSQSTRLDFHILNELILYQQHALTSQALGNRAPARRAPQPQPLPSRSLLPRIPRKVGWGEPLRRTNYSYKLLLFVLILFPLSSEGNALGVLDFFFPLTSLAFV